MTAPRGAGSNSTSNQFSSNCRKRDRSFRETAPKDEGREIGVSNQRVQPFAPTAFHPLECIAMIS